MTRVLFYYTNNKNDDPLDEAGMCKNGIIKSKTLHLHSQRLLIKSTGVQRLPRQKLLHRAQLQPFVKFPSVLNFSTFCLKIAISV